MLYCYCFGEDARRRGALTKQQSVFTPLGLRGFTQNGLFITPLRRFATTRENPVFEHRILFVNSDNINRTAKNANKIALEYYLTDKIKEIRETLLQTLQDSFMQELLQRDYFFDWEYSNISIEVADRYHKNITRYKNKCFLEYAKKHFTEYIWKLECERRYIAIKRKDGTGSALKLLETRYSNSYCDKIRKRMQWLAYTYRNSNCVLLTLTMDPKKFNNDKLLMCQVIKKEFHRFMEALRIFMKREGREFPKYIHAPEFQKNGNPHLHVLFFNATRLVDWRKIRDLWGNGFIYINRNKEGTKVRNPINYVTGYITKTFANVNFDNITTQSMAWLMAFKSFDRSRGLMAPLNPPSTGEWCLDYLVVLDRLNDVLDEMELIYKRLDVMLNPSLWAHPPPPYKGDYLIWHDDEEVVSTDSPFWASFFSGGN